MRTSAPSELTDPELHEAIDRLRAMESTVSTTRRHVQQVEQELTDELARRLRATSSAAS